MGTHFIFLGLVIGGFLAPAAQAQVQTPTGSILVHNVRLAAADSATRPTAIFLTLENKTEVNDHLVLVTTPACGRTEIHDHIHENGVMKMREVPDGVLIPVGQSVIFKPMGLHVMCFDPVLPQTPGTTFRLRLTFRSGAAVDILDGQVLTMADLLRRNTEPEPRSHAH